ncbi:MAG: hypothetical protein U1D69_13655 [Polynucleobacter sp.]|nr:hypothetical protein [Polynucleobacter sp.]
MDEISKSLLSPSWWISVVVVGVLVNLLSTYMKPPIDSLLARINSVWRNRTERAKTEYLELLDKTANSQNLQILTLIEALKLRSKSNGWLAVAILDGLLLLATLQVRLAEILANAPSVKAPASILTSGQLLTALGVVAIVASMRCASAALDKEQLVQAARSKTIRSVA